MMHFTCDCCKQPIDPDSEMRYVVKLEVYGAMGLCDDDLDEDRDHLEELQDILERVEDAEDDCLGDDVYQQLRFDLCSHCRKKFVRNPLAGAAPQQFDFSKN